MPTAPLDRLDYRILHYLQNDARLTNLELAGKVGLSPSPCLRRVKALEDSGILKRYVAILDAVAVGLPISAFINVSLRSQEREALEQFQSRIASCPEVMECYLMTGTSDYLLRVVVPDLESYERFLGDKLTRIPGIGNIQTSFALKPVVYRTELPLAEAAGAGSKRPAKSRARTRR
ncbi:MAG: Lrp/AsnC family transcriptional regulator [Gammaproteobacteria bacterium]|nr:Lrp/AsnC family transcriptional regulator [Gammaproteobacteria bacterium]MBI5619124.1 Lrp/AsnC family transcriptional regulator [Gammaproteobacteria bacterium]